LLRARRERPRGRATEQRYELAALHSITSSARNMRQCIDNGTRRQRAPRVVGAAVTTCAWLSFSFPWRGSLGPDQDHVLPLAIKFNLVESQSNFFYRWKLPLRYGYRLHRYLFQRQDKEIWPGALLIDNSQYALLKYLVPLGLSQKHRRSKIDQFLNRYIQNV